MFNKHIAILLILSIVSGVSCYDSKQKMSIVPLDMLDVTDSLMVEGKMLVSRTEYYLVKEFTDTKKSEKFIDSFVSTNKADNFQAFGYILHKAKTICTNRNRSG